MGNYVSLAKGQAEALLKFLQTRLTSVDELAEEMGYDDAFRMFRLMQRLERVTESDE